MFVSRKYPRELQLIASSHRVSLIGFNLRVSTPPRATKAPPRKFSQTVQSLTGATTTTALASAFSASSVVVLYFYPGRSVTHNIHTCQRLRHTNIIVGVGKERRIKIGPWRYYLKRQHPLVELPRGLLALCRRPYGGERHWHAIA